MGNFFFLFTFPADISAFRPSMHCTVKNVKTSIIKTFIYNRLTGVLNFGSLVNLCFSLLLAGILLPTLLCAQLEDWDSDQDAMPNGWEFYRGLDVDDAKDAWTDPDGDGIVNLYEYYLGSDPQDKHQPKLVNLQAGQSLAEAIQNADRGTVLRVPQGTYELNYRSDNSAPPPRLMLQGGWNEDFTKQDHCRYPTVLDGAQNGAIFNLLIATGNSAALVFDGFTLQGGSSGAIQYTGYLAKAQLLLANCRLIGNRSHRASAILNFTDGAGTSLISDLILVNTLIAGNKGTAIRAEQYATRTNLKILHSIIALNEPSENDSAPFTSGYGMDVYPDSDSTFYLQIINSVLWGNSNTEVRFANLDQQRLKARIMHNLLGFLPESIRLALFSHPSNRSIDPLLKPANDKQSFSFEENSPIVQAGTDIGFFPDGTPDIGAKICDDQLATSGFFPHQGDSGWRLYPNPAPERIFLEGYLQKSGTLRTTLYNATGQKLKTKYHGQQAEGPMVLSLNTQSLAKGWYFLVLNTGTQYFTVSFIK